MWFLLHTNDHVFIDHRDAVSWGSGSSSKMLVRTLEGLTLKELNLKAVLLVTNCDKDYCHLKLKTPMGYSEAHAVKRTFLI